MILQHTLITLARTMSLCERPLFFDAIFKNASCASWN